jgi:hypothetical protein
MPLSLTRMPASRPEIGKPPLRCVNPASFRTRSTPVNAVASSFSYWSGRLK